MNKKLFNTFAIAYLIVAVIQVGGEFIESETLRFIFKPLLMPILGVGLYKGLQNKGSKFSKFILAGIFFAWFGDIFLMFETTEAFFIAGLISFLITHVFYMLAYFLLWRKDFSNTLVAKKPYILIPFIVFLGVLLYVLFPNLEDMLLPVIVYSIVITLMTVFALNNYGFTRAVAFWFIFAGCVIFMLSDTLIAFNKFYQLIPYSSVLIMTTYISAQYFIAKGCLEHNLKES